ncbi:hypothetical protein HZH66_010814 [Vespula vulgaris]|uniref:Uncharacterized protein n=1 Tax=Vespula vulgaris TaxID=7454 RepID=A0A834JJ09_VESVU|nr:hypothetical protein HZH66_010814 [Vespula vulgaris]
METQYYVKNCDKVEGHLASFFLMLPASKKKEASPLNIKRRGRRTSSRLENKQKGAKMWLKVLRQNISHLARRAKGNNYIKQFWTWEKRKRKRFFFYQHVYVIHFCLLSFLRLLLLN